MTIWYAQMASQPITAANQWNAAPDGSGAWLAWGNLAPDDVLCANGKTNVYVTTSFTCQRITTAGGANGGQFLVQNGVWTYTLSCYVVAGTSVCLRIDNTGGTITVIGNATGGSGNSCHGIWKYSGAGAVLLYGNAVGGTGNSAMGVQSANDGAVTIFGNAVGGTNWAAYGATGNGLNAMVTVVGNVINSAQAPGVAGLYRWQPASPAHYFQIAVDETTNRRYTVAPSRGDVRDGVEYGYDGETLADGTLVIPSAVDVRSGVAYGADGTELTGTLLPGGVPLIGPGGLVG